MLSLWACTGDSEGSGKKAGGTGRKARSGTFTIYSFNAAILVHS